MSPKPGNEHQSSDGQKNSGKNLIAALRHSRLNTWFFRRTARREFFHGIDYISEFPPVQQDLQGRFFILNSPFSGK